MSERLDYQVPKIQFIEDPYYGTLKKPVGLLCELRTQKLVLPPGITDQKYAYIFDAYLDGAFNGLRSNAHTLTYLSSGHSYASLGRIENITQASMKQRIKKQLHTVWDQTSDKTKVKYPLELAIAGRGMNFKKVGQAIEQTQREQIRLNTKTRMAQQDTREHLRQTSTTFMTDDQRQILRDAAFAQWADPVARENVRRTRIIRGMESRAKVAILDPEKAASLEKIAKKPYLKQIAYALDQLRARKFPEYTPEPKVTRKIKERKPKTPKPKIETVKIIKVSKPKEAPKPVQKPERKTAPRLLKARERNPFKFAVSILEFMQGDTFPSEIKDFFTQHPDARVEWSAPLAQIRHLPTIRYQAGKPWYVTTYEDGNELKSELSAAHLHLDPDNADSLARLTREAIVQQLETTMMLYAIQNNII